MLARQATWVGGVFGWLLSGVVACWTLVALFGFIFPGAALRMLLVLLAGSALLAGFTWYAIVRWVGRGGLERGPVSQPAILLGTAWLLCLGTLPASTLPQSDGGPQNGGPQTGAPPSVPAGQLPITSVKPMLDAPPIHVPFMADVVFPAGPSSFVAVGRAATAFNPTFEVWNIENMRRVGHIVPSTKGLGGLVLRRDGRCIATRNGKDIQLLFTDGDPVTLGPAGSDIELMAFAGLDRLITLRRENNQRVAEVWDLARKQPTATVKSTGSSEARRVAVDPAGKRLAAVENGYMTVQELRTGATPLGVPLPAPKGNFGLDSQALAFSLDGQHLAALLSEAFAGWRIVVWDVGRMAQVADFSYPENFGGALRDPHGFAGPVIQWLPDDSGWLMYGQIRIDRASGKKAGEPLLPEGKPAPRCQVLTPRLALAHVPLGGLAGSELRVVALPKR